MIISLGLRKGLAAHMQFMLHVISLIVGCRWANLCAIDLTKAFDKVNHFALYIKLMKRYETGKN